MFFFSLSSWQLALLIFAVVGSATLAGHLGGRYLRKHSGKLREPFGVVQGALLGVVGLILAFGLSLAVGRYEDRRAATGRRTCAPSCSRNRLGPCRWTCCAATPPSR
jgi:MFS family permease